MGSEPFRGEDGVKAAYSAIVSYHNGLVQTRFTIAGLFVAANGLLAGGYLQATSSGATGLMVPGMGVLLALVCWLLEVRTYQLLENLGIRGQRLEKEMGLDESQGFFALMSHQPLGPRILLTSIRLPANRFVRYLFSHSMGVGLLYNGVGVFWLVVLAARAIGA
jgi:hypothetical protein